MVSLISVGDSSLKNILALVGLSTDTKPTTKVDIYTLSNGSTFTEMDTGKVYMFSEENHTWYEL